MLCHRANAVIAEERGALRAIFNPAEHRENRRRIELFSLGGDARENFLERAELLGFIVDDEIALVAKLLDVLAQDPDAKGMERAEGGGGVFRVVCYVFRARGNGSLGG